MLTKRQTLWALPLLILLFCALSFAGYALEEWVQADMTELLPVLVVAFILNILALIFIGFSVFVSLGTLLVFNASGPQFWRQIGNPFYYLLWRELQEATLQVELETDLGGAESQTAAEAGTLSPPATPVFPQSR
jgi:glucan phosphoethanolaminetransferase (alkaline phosphatase superfamily)